MNNLQLTNYLNEGTKNIIKRILRSSLLNTRETMFLLRMKSELKKSSTLRIKSEKKGIHIPAFLISSITNNCNLFCKGCYARENKICDVNNQKKMLTADDWRNIFRDAAELGISFNLLAGGEPLLRRDVLEEAARVKNMIFPVFTNGTLINKDYINFFNENRNIVPIISIEGNQETTDVRRGVGTYRKLSDAFVLLKNKKILFCASITVSKENINEVTGKDFIDKLNVFGVKVVLFIEYVPVDRKTEHLAFNEEDREILEEKQDALRREYGSILFLSFPGDEKYMGGCLAAGRGFFHINSDGAAEACPFSPFSDCNIKKDGLRAVLESALFKKIVDINIADNNHTGGCSLFEKEEIVKELIKK